jgi:hypothetical protein
MNDYTLNATKVIFDKIDAEIILSFGRFSATGDVLAYVMLQKSTVPEEDFGVYIEIDDQGNSGYEMIKAIETATGYIQIKLTKPLSENLPVTNIIVSYPSSAENDDVVEKGLLALQDK